MRLKKPFKFRFIPLELNARVRSIRLRASTARRCAVRLYYIHEVINMPVYIKDVNHLARIKINNIVIVPYER